ncbi:hypothetical protein SAMD00019534_114040 [Acytostelium subglobosum LB1]|uniref:hypothetical protein n=1 Tax=Acytostelium subglobosum LB1 TaxID=1410327 RepID=UPI0006451942|nr:hypothetical protein SAMD00019534_114040 [Acytostelium subglobosum LB1]GAM28228.1 hypothetical protein SAMD00019534_114040 [Acytostelium subglobosum LB1]|eukprot:XP_012748862.1 hypothetical protein SAMD00019534_114040 [Acytostelium subglobosum LB1]
MDANTSILAEDTSVVNANVANKGGDTSVNTSVINDTSVLDTSLNTSMYVNNKTNDNNNNTSSSRLAKAKHDHFNTSPPYFAIIVLFNRDGTFSKQNKVKMFDNPLRFGRDNTCNFVLDRPGVEPFHLEIYYDNVIKQFILNPLCSMSKSDTIRLNFIPGIYKKVILCNNDIVSVAFRSFKVVFNMDVGGVDIPNSFFDSPFLPGTTTAISKPISSFPMALDPLPHYGERPIATSASTSTHNTSADPLLAFTKKKPLIKKPTPRTSFAGIMTSEPLNDKSMNVHETIWKKHQDEKKEKDEAKNDEESDQDQDQDMLDNKEKPFVRLPLHKSIKQQPSTVSKPDNAAATAAATPATPTKTSNPKIKAKTKTLNTSTVTDESGSDCGEPEDKHKNDIVISLGSKRTLDVGYRQVPSSKKRASVKKSRIEDEMVERVKVKKDEEVEVEDEDEEVEQEEEEEEDDVEEQVEEEEEEVVEKKKKIVRRIVKMVRKTHPKVKEEVHSDLDMDDEEQEDDDVDDDDDDDDVSDISPIKPPPKKKVQQKTPKKQTTPRTKKTTPGRQRSIYVDAETEESDEDDSDEDGKVNIPEGAISWKTANIFIPKPAQGKSLEAALKMHRQYYDSEPDRSVKQSESKESLLKILDGMKSVKYDNKSCVIVGHYRRLVQGEDANLTRYYEKITNPLSLCIIKNRMLKGHYNTQNLPGCICMDFEVMVENHLRFFGAKSDEGVCGLVLLEHLYNTLNQQSLLTDEEFAAKSTRLENMYKGKYGAKAEATPKRRKSVNESHDVSMAEETEHQDEDDADYDNINIVNSELPYTDSEGDM